mmetsp:Transcript_85072/g.214429  ORF Transcript_85072/g.214429 Transcript_85072/m.214429 type:complete len:451 (+) Transcript_85072:81-1433(+)
MSPSRLSDSGNRKNVAPPRVKGVPSSGRQRDALVTFRDVVNMAADSRVSVVAFQEQFEQLLSRSEWRAKAELPAVANEFRRTIKELRVVCASLSERVVKDLAENVEKEAHDGKSSSEQLAVIMAAKHRGTDLFKQKDFAGAEAEYTRAIRAAGRDDEVLPILYSNRSAARLELMGGDMQAALADARQCIALAPQWSKAHFREGCCLRQLGYLYDASRAFRAGRALDPKSDVWDKEIEKIEQERAATLPVLALPFLFTLIPDLLWAWARGRDATGVLHVRIRSTCEFEELGKPAWQSKEQGQASPDMDLRYAFMSRACYLANLVQNLKEPSSEVATVDLDGQPLKIADIMKFLPDQQAERAAFHLDLQCAGRSFAIVLQLPCDQVVRSLLGTRKEPEMLRKREVKKIVSDLKETGFRVALPSLVGFQKHPGALAFPAVDLQDVAVEMRRSP